METNLGSKPGSIFYTYARENCLAPRMEKEHRAGIYPRLSI